ncbi:hypothetical protein [Methermicoccus shengliensis]|nr:hypothetical protein [Methermicoccus shengliensis]KUK03975.1 MAG: hypothetical protein XD46_1295 [Euryarchaeota archaeon 55_53]KUK29650.1 MAG: hypothetical protein XD62_1257 [Methanosarcinales archeaon 56_1174]MDI3488652.1 CRISPR-associated exonuclease Cas4 [Methanosarcinales archaeon]MDN5295892.1 CRISPR-associated exonuclease Cas4 [Methanosarcinales archaeon]
MMARVSEIPIYAACPLRLRLVREGRHLWGDEQRHALRIVHKEWALRYHLALADDRASIVEGLLRELSWVKDNVARIHPEIEQSTLSHVASELAALAGEVARGLEVLAKDGRGWMIEPLKIQHTMYSDELGLSGTVDKLVGDGDDGLIPSIIRTGNAPSVGVWAMDRLQATGYALLMEEEGERPKWAQVEYASAGVVRRFPIRAAERRECLRCIEGIHTLNERAKPNYRACARCPLKDECPTRGTLLSRLLGRF